MSILPRTKRAWRTAGLAAFAGCVIAPVALAGPPAAAPRHSAVPVDDPPVLDGAVLDDVAWEGASVATGFWQTQPDAWEPATERTEVRLVYTGETLYFGVVCYDRNPPGIVVTESRRDSPLDETDSFQIILDTYLDRQNGFVFGTNPAGIEYDGQVIREGQGGGRSFRGTSVC